MQARTGWGFGWWRQIGWLELRAWLEVLAGREQPTSPDSWQGRDRDPWWLEQDRIRRERRGW